MADRKDVRRTARSMQAPPLLPAWTCGHRQSISRYNQFPYINIREAHPVHAALFPADQPSQTVRLKRTLLGCAFYALCGLIIAFCTWQGLYPAFALVLYGIAFLAVSAGFFAITRFGWNLHFRDASMTGAQIACASLICSYSLIYAGPFRGVFMFAYVVGMMFGGSNLTMPQMVRLALFQALLFPVAVFVASRVEPASVDWRVEVVNGIALWVLLAITVLMVGNLSRLRARLKASNVELAAALSRLTDTAVRDDLTGLYNRRYLLDMIEREKSKAERTPGAVFCVSLIDIDHFKPINDTYGHGEGDNVLRSFATTAARCIRSADLLARWGGEEFLLLLPHTSIDLASACVERIKAELETTVFDGLEPGYRVTISAGIAQCRSGESIERLIERADAAMYEAKRSGRNRIVTADAAQADVKVFM